MSEFRPERYGQELARGLALSGESAEYFAERRVRFVTGQCRRCGLAPARVLELGCGGGTNLRFLQAAFPGAAVIGLDSSAAMLNAARERLAGSGIELAPSDGYAELRAADLVFVNGVFHHVAPPAREALLRRIHGLLRPGGLLSLFDNNPLNPGAMWVMKRIEFDRDARPVLARTLERLAARAGFTAIERRTHFYFPRPLAALRPLERLLERVPLGAQYVVYARASSV